MPAIDATLLAGIRNLRSFTQGCDLEALAKTTDDPLILIETLVRTARVKKDEIGRFWGAQVRAAFVDPFATIVTREAIALLPGEIAIKASVLPLYVLGDTLTLALAHPEDEPLVERLGKIAQMPVSAVLALPSDVTDLLRVHYSTETSLKESLEQVAAHTLFTSGADLSEGGREIARLAESEQITRLVEALIFFALQQGASDIHIEPREAEAHVRYRIDGTLREVLTYERKLHAAVVIRLKLLGNLNISDSRVPADGRFSMAVGTNKIDFRFSSIPSQYGEKAVVRALGSTRGRGLLTLDRMMISQSVLVPFRRIIESPSGIILVTGPTGSGKTTTLYAALAELNKSGVNISTIEDPIEMKLEGITQTQVETAIDMSFARMLRSLLRQDPDILLVGEIRDLETAKIAMQAALTGHLVLATLHTNSAPEAFLRLEEMGVDRYMIAPSVIGVLGQRLAPKICESCKEQYKPSLDVLRRYFDDAEMPEVMFCRGRGCHLCNGTGYKGRVAFHELFVVNRNIRAMLTQRVSGQELEAAGQRLGYRPLRYDGLKKVLLGLTTIEEIEAQTPIEFEE
jgi:type IV pilus assembly protein PilB